MPHHLAPLPSGPFERADLSALGLSREELVALLACGAVQQPLRGIYLSRTSAEDVANRAAALARRLPRGAAVARLTAAWLHGIDARGPSEWQLPPPLECLVPVAATPPRWPGVRVRQADVPTQDVVTIAGIPVTSAERTALDLARHPAPHMGLAVLDAMAGSGLIEPAAVADRLLPLAGQRFVARARRLVELCEPSTESFGESWLRLQLVDAGFPRPEPQIWIVDAADRHLYRLDMGWRERKVAVEYDGVEHHDSPAARAADLQRRDRLAREHGWLVVGVRRGEVLGSSLQLELGVGELLGLHPSIQRRAW